MVDLCPLNGLKFNKSKVNDLASVISPPYDIISDGLKEKLKKFNDFNIVNLILPDASGSLDPYENASSILDKWMDEKILIKDEKKNIYIFEEKYMQDNMLKSIIGIIGLIKIEDYESKIVLRHEKTLAKPREDRLNLLRKCKTNFGLIYTLYHDDKNIVNNLIDTNIKKTPDISLKPRYDESLIFNVWKFSDEDEINRLTNYMKDKKILIADGHHRYETSRLYRLEKAADRVDSAENYVLVLLMDINQKNIELLPTHRLIKFKEDIDSRIMKNILKKDFEIIDLENNSDASPNQLSKFMLEEQKKGKKSFMLCTKNNEIFLVRLKKDISKIYNTKNIVDSIYENLDVNILHKLIFEDNLRDYEIQDISFTHEISQILEKVREGNDFDIGVLLNAPDKNEVMTLSLNEKLMPQKSTYFYPKPCTGLLMYKFE